MNILVSLPITETHKAALLAAAPEAAFRWTTEETATSTDVVWADAILGNVPVALISQNQHLCWFQSNWAGPDVYLAEGVLPASCLVTNSTGAYGTAIAEWMLAMWLCLLKDLQLYRDRQNRQEWNRIERPVRSIAGSKLLCVGLGDIGSSFARRAAALGAEVTGIRRTAPQACPPYCVRVAGAAELDSLLPQADCVALSLPGTPQTEHLFGAARIARMKPGAILLNVGRGTAVDNLALAQALHSGRLFGAALDVTAPEPLPPDHPLWREPSCLITPHTSGRFSLPKTLDNIVDIFAHNLALFAAGLPLDNQVSRLTHYVSADSAGQRLALDSANAAL